MINLSVMTSLLEELLMYLPLGKQHRTGDFTDCG
jgi:hypothetical protein